jgi:hypothetical protein
MSVGRNPTASQQEMKNLPVAKFFSFYDGVVDTDD